MGSRTGWSEAEDLICFTVFSSIAYNSPMPHFVYILKCADGTYYTGRTADLDRRLWEHQTGVERKAYTYTRRPVRLLWVVERETKEAAVNFERQIKGWSRKKKEALIQGEWDMIHQIVKDDRKRREAKKRNSD